MNWMNLLLVGGGVTAGAFGLMMSRPPAEPPRRPRGDTAMPYLHRLPAESLARFSELAEQRNPFRRSRRPGVVTAPPVDRRESVAPLPALRLQGIVGGPPWSAVVEGVPSREGAVLLQPGDTAGGIRIVRVGPGAVVVTARDSTWTLRLREVVP